MCWVSVENCPCCHKKISFKELNQIVAKANFDDNKNMRCLHCNKTIGDKKRLDRYLWLLAIVVMVIGIFLNNLIEAFFSLLIVIVIFIINLNKIISLECRYKKYL